ncbi:MAG: DUF2723 domain-containing protein, partial [Chloroflexota bacterium]
LEFQLVGYRLAIAHPTGYPLYTLLLKLITFLPFGDVAYRANVLSAVCAALAVMLVYRIVMRLTVSVCAALVAAIALAVSPVFWSQAVVAEVYALNAVFVAAIVWRLEVGGWKLEVGRNAMLAFLFGLALTHHRTIILLVPALVIYVWQVLKSQIANRKSQRMSDVTRHASRITFCFLLPFTLYLYLPLRGDVGSLDGTYENTLAGFVRWVTASNYNIFLTGNPFNAHYDAAFFINLFVAQFGWLGLALAVVGFVALLRRPVGIWNLGWFDSAHHRFVIFLVVAFCTYLAFVLFYRVPDVQVFAIPAFLILAIALGCGVQAISQLATHYGVDALADFRAPAVAFTPTVLRLGIRGLLLLVLAINFTLICPSSFAQNDLSGKTDVRDYGRDLLAQPLPADATLVGILGEMTLVRYLQATEGLQPSLTTIAADRDAERLAAIEHTMQSGHAVFTTRPLDELAAKFSLGAVGPLVRVWPTPPPSDLPLDAPRVDAIQYRVDGVTLPRPRVVRVLVAWAPTTPITSDLKISARLLDGDTLLAQYDDWPVHSAYHTNYWRVGEVVHDVYDVRVPTDTPPQTARVLLIVYRAESGAEIGRIEAGAVEVK